MGGNNRCQAASFQRRSALPAGRVPALVDASAREFVDRSVAVDDVLSTDILTELELGPDAPPPMIAHEFVRLVRRACRRRTTRAMLPDAVPPALTVAELACRLDEPTRSLRERAHREVGLSLKRTPRVLRLHAALHARRNGHSWSEVAYAAGYADQAHLTRELRALLGETPSMWQARGSAVSFKTANRAIGQNIEHMPYMYSTGLFDRAWSRYRKTIQSTGGLTWPATSHARTGILPAFRGETIGEMTDGIAYLGLTPTPL